MGKHRSSNSDQAVSATDLILQNTPAPEAPTDVIPTTVIPTTAIHAEPADVIGLPTPAPSVIRRSTPWVGASTVAAGVIAAGIVMGPSPDVATAAAVSPDTTGSIPRIDAAMLDSGPITAQQEQAELRQMARQVEAEEKARHEAQAAQAAQEAATRAAQEHAAQVRRDQEAAQARQAAQERPSTVSRPAGATGTSRSAPAASGAASSAPAPVASSSVGAQVVAFAMAQRGKPYVWGAVGPSSYDCSGLVLAAYKSAGISLPRTSGAQAGAGRAITRDQLQPGDLVFYYTPISHVAIYIGNGQVVQAATDGIPVGVMSLTWGGTPTAYRHIA